VRQLSKFPVLRRASVAVVLVAVSGVFLATPPAGAADPLKEAEARVTSARRAVQEAAEALQAGEAEYGRIDGEVKQAQHQIKTLKAQQAHLGEVARERAIAAYIRPTVTIDDVVDTSDLLAAERRAELLDGANSQSNAAIDKLDAVTEDLHVREVSLQNQLESQRTTLEKLHAQEAAVNRALAEATRAEQNLRARLERERKLREYAARVQRARDAARRSAPTVGQPGIIIRTGDWVCPVQGGVSFTDTWGAPRSGGRKHKGVDMFGAAGTPIVAVVSGSVFFQGDPAGGNAAYVNGHDGNTYYYAHLADYVGGPRSVQAGELIGHLGSSGNADGNAPHLHFEIRPGGPAAPAINPYPTVAAHC
jgi:murein DD-endopeptidase MepM/ murein hydrolase activator NlpD